MAVSLDPRIKCVIRPDGGRIWTALVSRGFDGVGKRKQWRWTYTGSNRKEEVQRAFQQWLGEREKQPARRIRLTFRAYADQWIADQRTEVRQSTWARYFELLYLHIIPGIGGVGIQKLTGDDLRVLYRRLETSLSSTTVALIHGLVHKVLADALEDGKIAANAAAFKRGRPKRRRSEIQILSAGEITQLLGVARTTRWYTIFALAFLTGARRGELCGLIWRDFDAERGTLAIRRSRSHVRVPKHADDGSLTYTSVTGTKDTKTGKERVVALSEQTVTLLRQHKRSLASMRVPKADDPIFPNVDERGQWIPEPLFPDMVTKMFAKLCAKAELTGVHFHSARHTHASALLALNIHPKLVSERLGHTSVKLTLDTYSHATASLQTEAAKQVDTVIRLPISETA